MSLRPRKREWLAQDHTAGNGMALHKVPRWGWILLQDISAGYALGWVGSCSFSLGEAGVLFSARVDRGWEASRGRHFLMEEQNLEEKPCE